ncbi:LTA synthase family protein [Algoriphagus namhaensis]|uniref:LTA synthase family protein n=1 Tax=Algoriphagus namhaensis TaxID=915353 RepID=A0ABV8ASW2_9BACT
MAQVAAIRSKLPSQLTHSFQKFWGMALIFLVLTLALRLLESYLVFQNHVLDFSFSEVFISCLLNDINWTAYFLGLLLILYFFFDFISPVFAKFFVQLALCLELVVQGLLTFYFTKTLLPLGQDLFAYSRKDLILTVQASGQLNAVNGVLFVLLFGLLFYLLNLGTRWFKFKPKVLLTLSITIFFILISSFALKEYQQDELNVNRKNITLNKVQYLAFESFDYFMYPGEYYFDFFLRSANDALFVQKDFKDNSYPFAFEADYPDVLSPFFDSLDQAPDIVIVLIESLGKAYSGKDAYLGSFTPFLDSLENHSLVWTNAISSTGRTFGILPGILSGLPYGNTGFLELQQNYPNHNSLISQLAKTGYESHYFIGADRNFDHQGAFLNYQGIDHLNDIRTFDSKFEKSPSNNGFSWGYADKELIRDALQKLPLAPNKPQLRIIQTQTSHDPYIVPERPYYSEKFQKHLSEKLRLSIDQIEDYRVYQDIYMTILYADDAVKEFINEYQKRPEFKNTIFIFTGDHRLPEIPMASRLDRFHVPLMIYSPKINRPSYFKGMISHFEVTPSLLAFLEGQGFLEMETSMAWMGQVLDTAANFQAKLAMPLMRNKNQLLDYIGGEYMLSEGELFVISDNLNIDPAVAPNISNQLLGEFEEFKNKNNYMMETRRLLPLR